MRKQTKLAVGLSAAALLAIGASMTSFAARGWVAEGDQWFYYDNNGYYVTDKWKTYNGNYFYLGDEGYMLTNELIEDGNNYYYVDANGAMVKNAWVPVPADDTEEQDVEYRWHYFGSNGKAYKNADKKTINGKMLTGFVWLGEGTIKKNNEGVVGDQVDVDAISADELKLRDANFAYFSNDEEKDGSAKTGASIKIELYDDTYTFGFDKTTGMAYNTVKNNKVYNHGMLQTAGDSKYAVKHDGEGNAYLVSTNGTRMKAGKRTYKDDEDTFWFVADDGIYYGDTAAAAKLGVDGKTTKDGDVCHKWTEADSEE